MSRKEAFAFVDAFCVLIVGLLVGFHWHSVGVGIAAALGLQVLRPLQETP